MSPASREPAGPSASKRRPVPFCHSENRAVRGASLGDGNGRSPRGQTGDKMSRQIPMSNGCGQVRLGPYTFGGRRTLLGYSSGRAHPGANTVTMRGRRVVSRMLNIMRNGRAHGAAQHDQHRQQEQ